MKSLGLLLLLAIFAVSTLHADPFNLYPVGDVSTGSWAEVPSSGFFYAKINTSPTPSSDSDYIIGTGTAKFITGKVPAGWRSGNVTLTVRWGYNRASSGLPETTVLAVAVYTAGNVLLQTFTIPVTLGTGPQFVPIQDTVFSLGTLNYSSGRQLYVSVAAPVDDWGGLFGVTSIEFEYTLNKWQTFSY